MKAMCQAAWLLTVAFGNLVVIIVAESSIFANRVCEYIVHVAYVLSAKCLIDTCKYTQR